MQELFFFTLNNYNVVEIITTCRQTQNSLEFYVSTIMELHSTAFNAVLNKLSPYLSPVYREAILFIITDLFYILSNYTL